MGNSLEYELTAFGLGIEFHVWFTWLILGSPHKHPC